ncbi:unnamed protein product [Durusdinium trenchii]|uniref:Pentatricopeptide repeat-containing protein, chloroplastic n=1 Tax=Durusdinium trenchii TaxID=1381693 RepID=A0ABP0P2P8_9DINO
MAARRRHAEEPCSQLCGVDLLKNLRQRSLQVNLVEANQVLGQLDWREALEALQSMRRLAWRPTVRSFGAAVARVGAALGAGASTGAWRRGLTLLGEMQVLQVESNTICTNASMKALGRARWAQAAETLREMPWKWLQPSDVTFSSLVSSVSWRRAVRLSRANTISYNASISACEKDGAWEAATTLLAKMEASLVRVDRVSFNALQSALGSVAQWRAAIDLGSGGLRQDAITLGTLLAGCKEGHQWPLAAQLLFTADWSLPRRCYNACLSVYEHCCFWKDALVLYRHLCLAVGADEVSLNALSSAFASAGLWARAWALLRTMPEIRHVPDEISYNTAMDACKTGGRWLVAFFQLASCSNSHAPGVISYNSALHNLHSATAWNLCWALLQEMCCSRVAPSVVTLNTGLALHERQPHAWPKAVWMLFSMSRYSCRQDSISYAVSTPWCRSRQLLEHAQSKTLTPSPAALGAMVSSMPLVLWRQSLYFYHHVRGAATMLSRLRACDAVAAAHAANGAAAPLRALPEMLEGVAGAMQELRKKRLDLWSAGDLGMELELELFQTNLGQTPTKGSKGQASQRKSFGMQGIDQTGMPP